MGQVKFEKEERSLVKTIGATVLAGILFGILYLWIIEFTLKGFFASLIAGIIFCLPFGLIPHFYGLLEGLKFYVVTACSGSVAACVWWLVIQPQNFSLLQTMIIGFLLAPLGVFVELYFAPRE